MLNSNFTWILGLLVTACLLMTGCTLPKPQANDADSASFITEVREAKVTETTTIKGFSIPQSRTIHFEVCVTDLKMRKPIANHNFTITPDQMGASNEKTIGKSIDTVTNANGCLNWNESINFNYFADAKFVAINKIVEAKGIQKGSRLLRFAVNPWESQLVNLDKTTVSNLISAENAETNLLGENKKEKKSMIITDLRVYVSEKQTTEHGVTLAMEIRGTPSVEFRSASGEVSFQPLAEGSFKLQAHLIHTVANGSTEIRHELFKSEEIPVVSQRGLFSVITPITLVPNCVRGQYQLGVRLVAASPDKSGLNATIASLKPFEGVFYLSECEQIKGNFFAVLTNEASKKGANFSIDSYLAEQPTLEENIKTSVHTEGMTGYQKAQYEFSKMIITDYAYKNQEPILREREFLLRTCIFSGIDNKPLRAQEFTVKKANGTIAEKIRSSNLGCIEWNDSVAFNYFDQECKKPYTIEITNKELGIKQTIPVLINPWASNANAFEDIRDSKMQPRCAPGKTELRTVHFEFAKTEFKYGVDDFLNLKVRKTGVFTVAITLKRPSLTDPSGFAEENAPLGKYKLRLALLDGSAEADQDLSQKVFMTTEKVISLNGHGTLVDQITLEAFNLKEVGNTNKLWLEILPLDPAPNFKPMTFQGVFRYADDVISGNLYDYENHETSLVDKAKIALNKDTLAHAAVLSKLAPKAATADDLGLKLLNLNVESETAELRRQLGNPFAHLGPRPPMPITDLKTWLETGFFSKDLAAQFCMYWMETKLKEDLQKVYPGPVLKNSALDSAATARQCLMVTQRRPLDFFDIQYRYFVKKPHIIQDQHQSGSMQDFTISNAFNLGSSYVDSHTVTDSFDVGFGINPPKWFGLSASTGYRHSLAWAKQWSNQTATQQSFAGAVALKVEKISAKIWTESLEKCVIIKLRPETYMAPDSQLQQMLPYGMKLPDKSKVLRQGFILCAGESSKTPMVFTENFYIMNQLAIGLQVTDNSSNKNRPFFVALRGNEDFAQFLSYVHKESNIPDSYRGDSQIKETLTGRHKDLFLRGLPGSPGQFIGPR